MAPSGVRINGVSLHVPEESLSLDSFEVNLHFSSNESQSREQGQVQTIVINTNENSGHGVLTTSLHYSVTSIWLLVTRKGYVTYLNENLRQST